MAMSKMRSRCEQTVDRGGKAGRCKNVIVKTWLHLIFPGLEHRCLFHVTYALDKGHMHWRKAAHDIDDALSRWDAAVNAADGEKGAESA